MSLTTRSENPLETVSQYYLDPARLPKLKPELIKQVALLTACFTGIPLYIVPADAYAKEHYGDNLFEELSLDIGTSLPVLFMLWTTTNMFFRIRGAQIAPRGLSDILVNPLTYKQRLANDLSVLIGSVISALPLAAIAYEYPIPSAPEPVTYMLTVAALVDNTVLHFLPIQLALGEPMYRLPVYWAEYPISMFYKKCVLSARDQQLARIDEEKQKIHGELKGAFMSTLLAAANKVSVQGMVFNTSTLRYEMKLEDDLINVAATDLTPSLGLTKLVTLVKDLPSSAYTPPSMGNTIMRNLAYYLGGSWVLGGCSGYLATTVDTLVRLTGDETTGKVIAAPPVYFMGVLLFYFGAVTTMDLYDYLSNWEKTQPKWPLEFKCYPAASSLFILLAAYLSAFSYATANKLIEDSPTLAGEEWDDVREILIWMSRTAVPYGSAAAMRNFCIWGINLFATHFGRSDAKMAICLRNMIEAFMMGVNLLPGDELVKSLSKLDNERLKLFVHLSEGQFKEKCEALSNLDKEKAVLISQDDATVKSPLIVRPSYFTQITNTLSNSRKPPGDNGIEATDTSVNRKSYNANDEVVSSATRNNRR